MMRRIVLPPLVAARRIASTGVVLLLLAVFTVVGSVVGSGRAYADEPAPVDFVKHVLPLLDAHCAACHGPDLQESGLRVDAAALILRGGVHGPSVVPGKSSESLLVQVMQKETDLPRMPMSADPLSEAEIALIARWVDEGAKPPADEKIAPAARESHQHWAFQPVRRPELPEVANAHWVRTPVDRFILQQIEARGLPISPEADRATLIRRASLDLTGLLPTPAEVEAFVNDRRPGAYERLVDRLLESPHYGERWGRHWLDVARYADSNGFTIDGARQIWKYRDWVIEAMNRDLPFDRFTIEQLAGDLLPEATFEQLVATGFHRNTLINQEGGTDREQFRVESVVDRVSTTGSAWLGLTIGCAQCHEHKYDPISQREFYQMFAVFNTCDEPLLPAPTPQQAQREAELASALAVAEGKLRDFDREAAARQAAREAELAKLPLDVVWSTLELGDFAATRGATITKQPDGSHLASGRILGDETFVGNFEVPLKGGTAVRLEALTHESLPQGGPGLAGNGNFILTDFTVEKRSLAQPEKAVPVKVVRAVADHSQPRFPIEHAIDDDPSTSGWAINVTSAGAGSLNVDRQAIFILEAPLDEEVTRVTLTLRFGQSAPYALGRFRVSIATVPPEVLDLPNDLREALAVAPAERTAQQKAALAVELAERDPARGALQDDVNRLKKELDGLRRTFVTTMILREQPNPRKTHIHIRGDFLRLGAPVDPGVPAALNPLPADVQKPNRLDFARWLVDPANPLTSRVTVNRIWQRYFGRGLVETEDDFGTQGALPTHPELLDWLADEFVQQGWSMKAMHRLIATSAVYRQSSHVSREGLQKDPFNRYLSRQSRLRLEAEIIRDAALDAAGLLTSHIGGPSVFPPQPEGIYRFTQNNKGWTVSSGGDRFRRGMYTHFWRSSPDPFLMTFDAPGGNVTCTRRVRSNTPLQALTMANDPAFVEIARGLAGRVLRESPSPAWEERLATACRLCLSRLPDEQERALLTDFYEAQLKLYQQDEAGARLAAATDPPPQIPPAEAAAWTALARVLLNLDEFITRE